MKSVFIIFQALLLLTAGGAFVGSYLLNDMISSGFDPQKTDAMVERWESQLETWVGEPLTEERKFRIAESWRAMALIQTELSQGAQKLFSAGQMIFGAVLVFQVLSFLFLFIGRASGQTV